MRSLLRFSKALDSGDINGIVLAAESLEIAEIRDEFQDSVMSCCHKFLTLDLDKIRIGAEMVLGILFSCLQPQNLHSMRSRVLRQQIPVATRLVSEALPAENLKLEDSECVELLEKIQIPKMNKAESAAATIRLLRKSGVSRRKLEFLIADWLEECLPHFRETSKNPKFFEIPENFLIELAELDPGNPILEIQELPSTSLIPQCISLEYRAESGIRRFSEFLGSWSLYRDEDALKFFGVFEKYCEFLGGLEMQTKHVGILADFWYSAFRLSNGLDIQKTQKMIGLFKKSCDLFDLELRPLFIKRILKRIEEKKTTQIGYEPQIVAVLIDNYRRDIQCAEFQNELGELWNQLYSIKYDNIYNATSFYSALFILAKSQAIFKINKSLCSTVLSKILEPIHTQIVDFKNMKKTEKESSDVDNLGEEMFDYLVFTFNDARDVVKKFISEK